MILVDSSVWIDCFNGAATIECDALEPLHADRDFDAMDQHIGLRVDRPASVLSPVLLERFPG